MDAIKEFQAQRASRISDFGKDNEFKELANTWVETSMRKSYVYNFDWMGRPIIQFPEDIVAVQELIWKVKPDLIIETGIAHGGSLVLSASILAMLEYSEAVTNGEKLDPQNPKRCVLGIDIDLRQHNADALAQHPMRHRIKTVIGSSVDTDTVSQVQKIAEPYENVMVFLDSNHTHEHVLEELNAYSSLVSKNSYCVVFDTFVENMPEGFFADRPWDVSDNPMTAVSEFMKQQSDFEIDKSIENKLMITVAPNGFLKRVS